MSTPLLGFLSRHALAPSLRLVRGRLAANPDYRELRKWSARFDRPHLKPLPGASTSACAIGGMTAMWIDADGARRTRVILYLHGGAFIAETPGIVLSTTNKLIPPEPASESVLAATTK